MNRPKYAMVALAALGLAAAACAAQVGEPAEVEARIEAVERGVMPALQVEGRRDRLFTLEERMAFHGVPGVSIAVVNDGRVEWARGYGVAEVDTDRPVTAGTLFQAASMSKPVAALAALALAEQGQFSLDDDVNTLLSGWSVPENDFTRRSPVTVRRLLNHTAGTTVHGFGGYAAGRPVPSTEQVLLGEGPANSRPVVVDLEPGTRWRYSGGGTTVVQHLVATLTGTPFPELMRERVLEPLGMTESSYQQPLPADRAASAATGHRSNGQPVAGSYHTYPEMAAAGMWTTATDLARYIVAVQQSLAGTWNPVLSSEMTQEMLVPGLNDWGLGPSMEGQGEHLRFGHGGANAGFRGMLVGYVEGGRGAVVLTNSDAGQALAREIALGIARVYDWPDYGPRRIRPVELDAASMADFAGEYVVEGRAGTSVVVALDDGVLQLRAGTQPPAELVPTGADAFVELERGRRVRLERDEQGRVVAARIGNSRAVRQP